MMNPPKALAERFEKEVIVAKALWNELPVGQERLPYTADMLARRVNEIHGTSYRHELVSRYIEGMVNDGSIIRRGPIYGSKENGLFIGRNYAWTLAVPLDEALDRIARRQAQDAASFEANRSNGYKASAETRRGKPQKSTLPVKPRGQETVVVATRDDEEVRAIAGPEPDNTIAVKVRNAVRASRGTDEASALVEAARQYNDRESTMSAQIEDVIKTATNMGLTVDRQALYDALAYDKDERLENVALVLPYINMLEAAVERGQDNIRELRRKYSDYDEMKRDLRRLREERDRKLVSGLTPASN